LSGEEVINGLRKASGGYNLRLDNITEHSLLSTRLFRNKVKMLWL
jgi:hypothetical protein